MKIHFITYGDTLYTLAKERILREARETGWFATCRAYGPNDLTVDFRQRYASVLDQRRGCGYWIWKFDIVEQSLKTMDDGDLLVYCDAGCTVNAHGKKRFTEYCTDLVNSPHGTIAFQMNKQPEYRWTPLEWFDKLGMRPGDPTGHYVGGILILKKGTALQKVLGECNDLLKTHAYLLTDMGPNRGNQDPKYVENRHDQSLLSLIRKKYGAVVYPDETYCEEGNPFRKEFPFWATRWRQLASIH